MITRVRTSGLFSFDGQDFGVHHFSTIIDSIRARLLTSPADTVVHAGHRGSTTIGDEVSRIDEWIARGH